MQPSSTDDSKCVLVRPQPRRMGQKPHRHILNYYFEILKFFLNFTHNNKIILKTCGCIVANGAKSVTGATSQKHN